MHFNLTSGSTVYLTNQFSVMIQLQLDLVVILSHMTRFLLHSNGKGRCHLELPNTPVASFTKEVSSIFAKRPLVFNGRLANHGLTSLVKEATAGWLLGVYLGKFGRQLTMYHTVLESVFYIPAVVVFRLSTR